MSSQGNPDSRIPSADPNGELEAKPKGVRASITINVPYSLGSNQLEEEPSAEERAKQRAEWDRQLNELVRKLESIGKGRPQRDKVASGSGSSPIETETDELDPEDEEEGALSEEDEDAENDGSDVYDDGEDDGLRESRSDSELPPQMFRPKVEMSGAPADEIQLSVRVKVELWAGEGDGIFTGEVDEKAFEEAFAEVSDKESKPCSEFGLTINLVNPPPGLRPDEIEVKLISKDMREDGSPVVRRGIGKALKDF